MLVGAGFKPALPQRGSVHDVLVCDVVLLISPVYRTRAGLKPAPTGSISAWSTSMSIPKPVYDPPFNITRASHSVLMVKDLAVSRNFYVDLLGFIVSDEDRDALYLRGVAEACHHSLVLKRAR